MNSKVTDALLIQIFEEYVFIVILILCEKYDKHFRIKDAKLFFAVVKKYVNILQLHFATLFNDWKIKKHPHKLRNKMIAATIEDICRNKDEDFKNVFRILKYIINKNIHYNILQDLEQKIDKNATFKVNIGKQTLKVNHE